MMSCCRLVKPNLAKTESFSVECLLNKICVNIPHKDKEEESCSHQSSSWGWWQHTQHSKGWNRSIPVQTYLLTFISFWLTLRTFLLTWNTRKIFIFVRHASTVCMGSLQENTNTTVRSSSKEFLIHSDITA